jgi:hypothetical protein
MTAAWFFVFAISLFVLFSPGPTMAGAGESAGRRSALRSRRLFLRARARAFDNSTLLNLCVRLELNLSFRLEP